METEDNLRMKKTDDRTTYNRNYMKNRYAENPTYSRKYRNSCSMRKKYHIDDLTWKEFKEDLYNIIKIKELIEELNPGVFEKFLIKKNALKFDKVENMDL